MIADLNPELQTRLRILKTMMPLLITCPYTRVLFLAGSTARGDPKPSSDIDLVVISQDGRVWLNRVFLELAVFLIGRRRSRNKFEKRFCFNMFLSNKNPSLVHQDEIGAECYRHLKPLWGAQEEIDNFWRTNLWLKGLAPAGLAAEKILGEPSKIFSRVRKSCEEIMELAGLGLLLEKAARQFQSRYLKYVFNKAVVDKTSSDYDFQLGAGLIAYHFPVSNYAIATRKHRQKKGFSSAVENSG